MTMRASRTIVCIASLAVSLTLLAACPQGDATVKIDKLEPPQGTTAGGEEITIVGGGFQPGKTQAEVRFGRRKAEVVTIASTSKIKVVTPIGDKGPVDITVAFDDGKLFKLTSGFRYVEPSEGDSARKAFFSGGKPAGAAKIELEKK